MKSNAEYNVPLDDNPEIFLGVVPGHFTTSHAHVNQYLDINEIKTNMHMARDAAKVIAAPYLSGAAADTIVCLERTDVVGAFLAETLLSGRAGDAAGDAARGAERDAAGGNSMHIVAPMAGTNGNLIFQGSTAGLIYEKNVILLAATISSGRTIRKALECLAFYGGKVIGISALFLATKDLGIENVHALFQSDDIPDYYIWEPGECEMCKNGQKLDALISSGGYTMI
jgi:orotate phosphoribosyltransferase